MGLLYFIHSGEKKKKMVVLVKLFYAHDFQKYVLKEEDLDLNSYLFLPMYGRESIVMS